MMGSEYTPEEEADFEIAVRKLEGKCIDCNIQWAKKGYDRCALCEGKIKIEKFNNVEYSQETLKEYQALDSDVQEVILDILYEESHDTRIT